MNGEGAHAAGDEVGGLEGSIKVSTSEPPGFDVIDLKPVWGEGLLAAAVFATMLGAGGHGFAHCTADGHLNPGTEV